MKEEANVVFNHKPPSLMGAVLQEPMGERRGMWVWGCVLLLCRRQRSKGCRLRRRIRPFPCQSRQSHPSRPFHEYPKTSAGSPGTAQDCPGQSPVPTRCVKHAVYRLHRHGMMWWIVRRGGSKSPGIGGRKRDGRREEDQRGRETASLPPHRTNQTSCPTH